MKNNFGIFRITSYDVSNFLADSNLDPVEIPKQSANTWAEKIFLHNGENICIFPSLQSNMFSMKPPPILTLFMQGFKITFIDNHAIQNIQKYLCAAWGVLKLF